MGQYHIPVNFDRKEFINPHKFGDGLKLLEFGLSGMGTLSALTILLANSHNRGGGDLHTTKDEYMGRWAGQRIGILGDYSEPEDFIYDHFHFDREADFDDAMASVWGDRSSGEWKDISSGILATLVKDEYYRDHLMERLAATYEDSPLRHCAAEAGIPLPALTRGQTTL